MESDNVESSIRLYNLWFHYFVVPGLASKRAYDAARPGLIAAGEHWEEMKQKTIEPET